MKQGIYYAYWEKEWQADYGPYIDKAARLGFDVLEIACTPVPDWSRQQMADLKDRAKDRGITLTAGHGPSPQQNLASPDPQIRNNAVAFFTDLLQRLDFMDIRTIGGGIYSYWPVDMSQPLDKARDWEQSVKQVRRVGKIAQELGIDYCLEVLNRFEGYLINTAREGRSFLEQVDVPSVKLMLDTFHMNIEEDSFRDAITTAGDLLAHFHTGEANRKVPGSGRLPWQEIVCALVDIGYDEAMVMEPFVRRGGKVGTDIKIWRDLVPSEDPQALDQAASESAAFCRSLVRLCQDERQAFS